MRSFSETLTFFDLFNLPTLKSWFVTFDGERLKLGEELDDPSSSGETTVTYFLVENLGDRRLPETTEVRFELILDSRLLPTGLDFVLLKSG